ncbi:hypothetical protein IKG16_00405 [Candidatus Saccharibacteria bacterium]|nr:hypothetical protein [Candidatus Saccharibacteria bacterium]
MKIRTQILSAVLAGGLSISQGVGAYATGGLPEPVDDVPGTITINSINLGTNQLSVTYDDTGTDIDKVLRFTVAFINDGREMGAEDWTKINYPYWMTRLYDKATIENNSVQLLSGQTDVINSSQFYFDWLELGNITPGVLYYGAAVVLEGNDNVVRYIMGKADYRGCLAKYKEMNNDGMGMVGIQCLPEVKPSGKVIYAPYMGNVRLEMDEQYEQDDELEETEDPEEIEMPGESGIPEGLDSEEPIVSEESKKIENSEDVGGEGTMMSGNNSDVTAASNIARESVAATFGLASAQYGAATEEGNGDNEGMSEITVKAEESGQNTTGGEEDSAEVPDLGGKNDNKNMGNLAWWAIIPLAIAGLGTGAWWILSRENQKKSKKV